MWQPSVTRYDAYGERVAATDGRGVAVPDTTDTGGLTPTATVTDTQGLDTRHYAYDAQDDQTASGTPVIATTLNGITTTAPVTTTQGYDGDGNQTSVVSANGNTTTMAYDHLGQPISTTLPPVKLYDNTTTTPVETTGYDGDGNSTLRMSVSEINQAARDTVEDILTHPGSTLVTSERGRYAGEVFDVIAPDGRGLRYGSDGRFIGLLEPPR